ncbi:LEAF RUST 10 DISEASE-RESISTANCE LOCUS RECEPTOR-LIKE PROTEIN KINASE-like 1.1 [Lactuca sativa]|uniref:LEAF RUST 10 DISEASE-RESISTANCE LOCUS RECEPTOR-LIKE PROTEIN KINASE-like 1.1 n=1 Tax=Lactuca sativa TaxID=4236 RepID=UPI000CD9EAB3|nr:LEAF RUST 10 DISEASE-RESISTANCE LOCUS RECEPTOR-LIKE PROTEIN KINASE-like 1.1 [Lactuca sativa]
MILAIFFASVLLSCLPFLHSATDHNISKSICPKDFICPNFSPFTYPFYNTTDTNCGLIKVNCTSYGGEIEIGGESHEIVSKYVSDPLVMIHNKTFERLVNETKCEALAYNFTSPSPLLYSISILPFITLYKCTNHTNSINASKYFQQHNYSGYDRCNDHDFYYDYSMISYAEFLPDLPPTCQVIQLPVKFRGPNDPQVPDTTNIFSILGSTFSVSFNLSTPCHKCHQEDGQCNIHNGLFQCLDAKKEKQRRKLKLTLGVAGSSFILILFLVIFITWGRYKTNPFSYFSSKDKSPNAEDGSTLFHGASVFSYTELEDATRHFDPTRELGNGGFGAVYYGKLQDGREVAVKKLYEHNYKRVQQFVNEVRILTRLRHPNLVVLYGCTSRQSHELLLVCEYISNGTLADHLHGNRANASLLPWPLRMNIAIETARALVYLHASEIIHRDVKTSNILLDHNFSAKVADFGLSRLLPDDVNHVSTAPQGTPGYLDPQYHHRYQLTDKSDVYSFGVVLIELISSMVAVDLNRSQDEISLANLALNKIQRCALDQLIDPVLGSDSDREVMRMVTSVAELAFQCLQFYSEMRPTMNEVLDVLEDIQAQGRIDAEESKTLKPPTRSENTDTTVLLKNFPPSPVSVTGEWHSDSTGSTTLSIR